MLDGLAPGPHEVRVFAYGQQPGEVVRWEVVGGEQPKARSAAAAGDPPETSRSCPAPKDRVRTRAR